MTMAQQCTTYGSYNNEYGREYVYPAERMYVHSSVYLPSSELDPRTGLLKPDQPRRGRTQAMRLEYASLDKEYKQLDESFKKRMENPGIRMSLRTSIWLVVLIAFVLGLLLVSQQGTLAERQKALNRMNKSIEECAKTNDLLAGQISEASDSATICYAAARDLNMIPAETAEAIHLVAVDTRPMGSGAQFNITANQSSSSASQGVDSNGNGTNGEPPSADATMIPTLASAAQGH